ncbi:DEAD/DEAH box helicase family protein [Nocardioides sp. Y6]|uniref:DEAD/DEAH box helicase family protein n=1 Tax=Nocardioides malaquae TaxID=2773426 RepID=A0ABR9RU20_9ACTN|nr:DEAD/DEAH box helicase family protein [Nocardioides malaquae]MBE7325048.1 DEAD/DEAH box helicase family protein [Nocardioides malaquae]
MSGVAEEPGLRDSLVTRDLHRSLAAYGDRVVLEGLGNAEAVERLGKHLLTVARRMRAPKASDSLLQTVEIINQAVAALGGDFAEDQVLNPPRVLKGILPKTGLARTLPAHPHVPLTASELLVNGNGEPGFGTVLQGELDCAVNVDLICAFVGFTGLSALRQHLAGVVERGGRLRVITSTYLGATSAKAIDELVGMGAEVRINYQGHATKLHAKAWYFERGHEIDTAMVGSSNMSDAAFFTGLEWNVRLSQSDSPNVLNRVRQTFDSYWHDEQYELYDDSQRERLLAALAQAKGSGGARIAGASMAISQSEADLAAAYALTSLRAKPHQQVVLDRLALQREAFDEHRHLVVAATGTGKTVIAALDYARLCVAGQPRPRLLFVAHRKQILEQALSTFRFALKDPNFGGILAGGSSPTRDTHVFAMVQTLHQRLPGMTPDAYDVVYIDEAHHGTAQTWRDVINHFHPRELIGLTATPERTDGGSVADLFGGVYTTELRLWEAISDQLLCPFEYLGIDDGTDLTSVAWHGGSYALGELSEVLTRDDIQIRNVIRAVNTWVEAPSQMRALGFS